LKVTASKALLKPKLEFTSVGFCDTLKLRTFTAMPNKLHLTQTIKCTTYFITVSITGNATIASCEEVTHPRCVVSTWCKMLRRLCTWCGR